MDWILKNLYKLLLNPHPGTKVYFCREKYIITITHPSIRIEDKEQMYTEHMFYLAPDEKFGTSIQDKPYKLDDYLGLTQ